MYYILIIITVVFFLFISTYNSLIKSKNKVKRAYSLMDVMLKKRHDLIPNLIIAVKSIMHHEKSILDDITEKRIKIENSSEADRMTLESGLDILLPQLITATENYPELKTDENFKLLQHSIEDADGQIAVSRKNYNIEVKDYNDKIESFPSNILAKALNYKTSNYYQ